MAFGSPEGASHLLDQPRFKIVEASLNLVPIMVSRTPPYKEALDCLQFAYMGGWTGDYVAPASTVLVLSVL